VSLSELQRHEEALLAFDRAIELDGSSVPAHHNRGLALEKLNRPQEALAAYEEALRLDPDSAMTVRARAQLLADMPGRTRDALAAFERLVELTPGSARAWGARGAMLDRLGEHQRALDSFDRALEIDAEDALTLSNRANLLHRMGRFEEAEMAYVEAAKVDPANLDLLVNRAAILCNHLGRYEESLALHREVLEADPANANASRCIATCLGRMGSPEEAVKWLEAHLERWPDDAKGWQNLGLELLYGRKDPARAVTAFERALSVQHRFVGARLHRAFAMDELGRAAEAIAETEARIASGDADIEDLIIATTLLTEARDPEVRDAKRAVEYAQMAVQAARETPIAWFILGVALCRDGQWNMAHRALTEGFSLPYTRAGSESYRLWFSLCLWKLGKHEEARTAYEEVARELREKRRRSDRVERLRAEVEQLVRGSK
jgi:tetratricopeptide (TPR) repeat protein